MIFQNLRRIILAFIIVSPINALSSQVTEAPRQDLPLWEVGVIAVGLVSPDYPGSDEYQWLALPVPNIIYRGEFLRADRDGVRGIFFESDDWEFDISLDGNLPTDDDNDARAGMPDLDPLVEIGPSLKYTALRRGPSELGFVLPLRFAFSVFGEDRFIDHQGIVLNPEVTFRTRLRAWDRDVGLEMSAGPLFGYSGINDYFYEIDPQYARSDRHAYQASDGYMGSEISARVSMPLFGKTRFFASGNVTYLGGAANEQSPLFRDDLNMTIATGVTWSFYQSSETVSAPRR